MGSKFCIHCGTQMADDAVFCVACGQAAEAADQGAGGPEYAYTSAPPQESVPQQPGGYYQQPPQSQQPGGYYQQPPQSQQPGAYYQQQPGTPGPDSGPYYPPQPPAGGYPYAGGYPGPANAGPKKGSKGLLIGGIIGLVVLAAGIVVAVLLLGKPPAEKPGNGSINSSPSAAPVSQGNNENPVNNEKPSPVSDIVTDAALADIAGMWEGELQFTRMEGFDKLPADELPEDFDEMLEGFLTQPAPMTLEIDPDGNWELSADNEMGMYFSSDDFGSEEYQSNPLLLTGLKNGAFKVTYSEQVDEDEIAGKATFELGGTVHENSDGLYIEGTLRISMMMNGAPILEEADFKVMFAGPADTYETDSWDDDDDWEDDDPDASSSAIPDGPSLSTNVRPELEDFDWYCDDVFYSGAPYDAVYIYDFADLIGNWKAFFYYDPYAEVDALGYELLNITVSGDEYNVALTLDSYKYYYEPDGEEYDTSDSEILTEYGSYDGWILQVGQPGFMLYITDNYYLDGVQYALGYIEFESGEPAYIAMMRP